MAAAQYFETVQKLYIAFYQRPADPGGLLYWAQRLDNAGGDLSRVIAAFSGEPEFAELYDQNADGVVNNADASPLIDAVYNALFGHDPDAAGKSFYLTALNTGRYPDGRVASINSVVLDILNGARNDDAVTIANKLVAANRFTLAVDGRDGFGAAEFGQGVYAATYAGSFDAAAARAWLDAVTSAGSSVPSQADTTDFVRNNISDVGDALRSHRDFTVGYDSFSVGAGATTGNDTFSGVASLTIQSTGGIFGQEAIRAGSGADVLNVRALAGSAVDIVLDSVETVNVSLEASASFNASGWAGVEVINVDAAPLGQGPNGARVLVDNSRDFTVSDLTVSTKVTVGMGVQDVTVGYNALAAIQPVMGTISFDALASADSVTANGAQAVTVGGSGGFSISALNLVLTTGNSLVRVNASGGANLGLLDAGGSQNFVLNGSGSVTVTIKSQASSVSTEGIAAGTGAVTLSADTSLKYSGGAAYDNLVLLDSASLTSADALTGGAGPDKLTAALSATGALDNVTGFETGVFSAGTDISYKFSGFSTLTFSGAGNHTITASSLAAGATVNLAMASANNVNLDFLGGAATVNVNNSSTVSYGSIDVSGAATLDVNFQNTTADSTISRLGATGATAVSIDVTGSSKVAITDLFARDATSLVGTVTGGGNSLAVGNVYASGVTSVALDVAGAAAQLTMGELTVTGQALTFTGNASGQDALLNVAKINARGAGGSVTVAVNAGQDTFFGSGSSFGVSGTNTLVSVSLTAGGSAIVSAGDFVSIGSSISAINLNAAANGDIAMDSAMATVGITAITASGGQDARIQANSFSAGTIGSIGVVAGPSAVVTFGSGAATTTMGNITVDGVGNFGVTDLRALSLGNISVSGAVANFGTISASTVGNISLGGNSATMTIDASSIGTIAVTGSGASITIADSVSIGAVTVAGSGQVMVDFGNASGIASISTVGHAGTAAVNMSGVTRATTVTLGTGTNLVTLASAGAADVFTLQAGTGTDTLLFLASGASTRSVVNFGFASAAADTLAFTTAAFDLGLGSTTMTNMTAGALTVLNVSAGATTITLASAAASLDAATDVIVLTTGSVVSGSVIGGHISGGAMLASLSNLLTAGSVTTSLTAGQLLVVWYNGFENRTELSLVTTTAASTIGSAVAGASIKLLSTFSGADIVQTLSGDTFGGTFQAV